MSNAETISRALGGKRSGMGWIAPCVAHDDGSPSLSLADGENGRLLVHCFTGCDASNVLAELRSLGLLESNFKQDAIPKYTPAPARDAKKEWSAEAENIWRRTKSLYGSLAEIYLRARGCSIPDSDDLRFLSNYKGWPAMVSRVTCPLTNKPFTLHFTLLKPDGSGKADIERPKDVLFGHRLKGGVIRLSRDEDVTIGLAIAEGIETSLHCGWFPIWATGNAGNMAIFPVLNGIESLAIFADNDKSGTGLKSAKECSARWRNAGREVKIAMPAHTGEDWADL